MLAKFRATGLRTDEAIPRSGAAHGARGRSCYTIMTIRPEVTDPCNNSLSHFARISFRFPGRGSRNLHLGSGTSDTLILSRDMLDCTAHWDLNELLRSLCECSRRRPCGRSHCVSTRTRCCEGLFERAPARLEPRPVPSFTFRRFRHSTFRCANAPVVVARSLSLCC